MKFIFLTAISFALSLKTYCQTTPFGVFVSAGGTGQIEQTYLSWTMGEPFVGTLSSEDGSLSQGFSLESTPTLTAVENPELDQSMRVYPNPVADFLTVELLGPNRSYQLRVLDALGRVRLSETPVGTTKKTLDISLFSNGAYYVQVKDSKNKVFKTFKILILK